MHANSSFRQTSAEKNVEFAARRGFGSWIVHGPNGYPVIASTPFFFDESQKDTTKIKGHLARNNPLFEMLLHEKHLKCTLTVQGPDGYISPDWYIM